MRLIQVNLQRHFGGGEVFTAFLCRALDRLGVTTRLLHHPEAAFWETLNLPPSTEREQVANPQEIAYRLPAGPVWILSHGPLPEQVALQLAGRHLMTSIAHMPPQGRPSDNYPHCHLVFGVSRYVLDGLQKLGLPIWDTPLYGVADLAERPAESSLIIQRSCYAWDQRKGRDRLLGIIEPLLEPLRSRPRFEPRPGITLGIVSRLTPIKQFPEQFEILAPILARNEGVNLEIFGAGGYASVRDLRHALSPVGNRARFWGMQNNVAAIYRQLDFLMTGLPEKEALGLNVIEAQACDLPVLAVAAPPFTETVIDGLTGHFYCDPREDQGAGFSALLNCLMTAQTRLHPREAVDHLGKFTFDAFVARLAPIVKAMEARHV